MNSNGPCPRCGVRQIVDIEASLCPGCLFAAALDDPVPEQIADYDILHPELGEGGMGVVYRARQRSSGCIVALKEIRSSVLATPKARQRFRAEIELVATLHHPNIVPIYEIGEQEGCPYYTMPVYSGSLDKQMSRYREPGNAAELVATVARAVHHAHLRGVLHRDLKPGNILLDEHGQPHVGDFEAATRIDQPPKTEPSRVIGTPHYMAPEQARGDAQVTTAADVYSLGIVLYELITGKLPFEGDRRSGGQSGVEAEPIPPREVTPTVPRALQAICLKSLEEEPAERYRSAEELADDLDRFLRGEPIIARPAGLADRLWRTTRRHRLAVGAGVGTLMLLVGLAVIAISVARAQEVELQRDALRTNAYVAQALAGTVAFHLREQLDAVVTIAADPEIARLSVSQELLEQWRIRRPFDSLSIYDRTGTSIAHAPGTVHLGSDYSWRDYFVGARMLGEAGHRTGYVSLAFQSEADGHYKFGVSAPIFDGGVWVGVLLATIGTDSSLGSMRVDGEAASGPTAVLVAPQGRTRTDPNVAGKYVVVLHDRLTHGAGVPIESPRLEQLRVIRTERDQLRWSDPVPITDDAHRDPVPGFEGRWLAGFAPVGRTGFIVIVQSRYDAVVAPNARLSRRLVSWVGAVVLAWSLVFSAVLWIYARHQRRARMPRRGSVLVTSAFL